MRNATHACLPSDVLPAAARSRAKLATLAVLVVLGCDYDKYEVEITPRGDGFERKLTVWHVPEEGPEKPLAAAKLDALAA